MFKPLVFVVLGLLVALAAGTAPSSDPWAAVRDSFTSESTLGASGIYIGKGNSNILFSATQRTFSRSSRVTLSDRFVGFTFDTTIPVASASKVMASVAIWTLIQDGTMHLSDNPQKYISWWTTNTSDSMYRVTLEQLLAFTSGFNGEYDCSGGEDMEQCVMQIHGNGTYTEPGTVYYYGGDHLQVAGLMAIKAGGYSDWNALFTARVKTPAGVANVGAFYVPLSNPRVAGGLFTTTHNYYKLFMAGFVYPTILNSTSLSLMQVDRTPSDSVTIAYSPAIALVTVGIPQSWHYCGSFWYECYNNTFTPECLANKQFSSPGAFGFYPFVDRVRDYWIIVGKQGNNFRDTVAWAYRAKPFILAALDELSAAPVASDAATAPALAPFAATTVAENAGLAPNNAESRFTSMTAVAGLMAAVACSVFMM